MPKNVELLRTHKYILKIREPDDFLLECGIRAKKHSFDQAFWESYLVMFFG
jgi:hypothetical protein